MDGSVKYVSLIFVAKSAEQFPSSFKLTELGGLKDGNYSANLGEKHMALRLLRGVRGEFVSDHSW